MGWRAWFTAPKDGSKIIALYPDFSGVLLLVWGVDDDGALGWISNEGEFEGDRSMAGWIPAPADTPYFTGWK